MTSSYPELTPYQFSGNSPIAFIDLDGLDVKAKKYNTSNDKSVALNEAMLAYRKTHQSEYNFNERNSL